MRPLVEALLAVLLAPACVCCRRSLDAPSTGAVCDPCWAAIPAPSSPLCVVCGDTLASFRSASPAATCVRCSRRRRIITRGRSIGPYEGTIREVLHALKYRGRWSVAGRLGELMSQRGADVLAGADCVVPVPLHFSRLYARGFNQAALLAGHLDKPVVSALRRTRATRTQTDLPEERRLNNVAGAFALKRGVDVRGRLVVLVDDVSTTGATLDACAQVLLEGGAQEVRALTAARAVARLHG